MTADAPAADHAARTPAGKRVTWAELFFDLVFVFAVTQLSASLHADHSLAGLGRALVLFVPVYWVWVSTSVHTNTRDVDNAFDRFGILAAGLGRRCCRSPVSSPLWARCACWSWWSSPSTCGSTPPAVGGDPGGAMSGTVQHRPTPC
ncbi:UNVERIFIED_ORG: hypothetical protein FHR35_008285 [Microbispora rosea subsp. rosea]